MLKILIVDDEEAAGNILKVLIEKHVSTPKEIVYCNTPEKGLETLVQFKPSLVMLDIEMPHMNGFDFLNNAVDCDFDVIFTTAYDKYAIKAIRFSALDYLLKPVDQLELQNAINRHIVKRDIFNRNDQQKLVQNLLQNIKTEDSRNFKLSVSVKEGVFLFDPQQIICLEGVNNYTKLYFEHQKPLLVSRTLKEYDEILADHGYIRVHKSFLINSRHITKIDNEGTLWLTNNITVAVSRRKRSEVMELFKQIPRNNKGLNK
jgi:two-component system, LytTR family, response regulator